MGSYRLSLAKLRSGPQPSPMAALNNGKPK